MLGYSVLFALSVCDSFLLVERSSCVLYRYGVSLSAEKDMVLTSMSYRKSRIPYTTHTHTRTRTHTHTHTHTHARTHSYTHVRTHSRTRARVCFCLFVIVVVERERERDRGGVHYTVFGNHNPLQLFRVTVKSGTFHLSPDIHGAFGHFNNQSVLTPLCANRFSMHVQAYPTPIGHANRFSMHVQTSPTSVGHRNCYSVHVLASPTSVGHRNCHSMHVLASPTPIRPE